MSNEMALNKRMENFNEHPALSSHDSLLHQHLLNPTNMIHSKEGNKENVPPTLFRFSDEGNKENVTESAISWKTQAVSLVKQFVSLKFSEVFGDEPFLKRQRRVAREEQKCKVTRVVEQFVQEVIQNQSSNRHHFENYSYDADHSQCGYFEPLLSRCKLTDEMLTLLFKTKENTADSVYAMLFSRSKRAVRSVREKFGMNVENFTFTARQMLDIHFRLEHSSYNLLQQVGKALSAVSNGFIKFETMASLRKHRDEYVCGEISEFIKPEGCPDGRPVGRMWKHEDMLPMVFEVDAIVQAYNFFPYGHEDESPQIVVESHYDGAEEHSYATSVNGVTRLIGLGDMERNPAAILINFLEESKESAPLMQKFIKDGVLPGLIKFYKEGVPVKCCDDSIGALHGRDFPFVHGTCLPVEIYDGFAAVFPSRPLGIGIKVFGIKTPFAIVNLNSRTMRTHTHTKLHFEHAMALWFPPNYSREK